MKTKSQKLGEFFNIGRDRGWDVQKQVWTVHQLINPEGKVFTLGEILDGIPQLGRIRYFFPTHYLDAWEPMFVNNRYPRDMIAGLLVQLGYLIVFGTAALLYFKRKDIRS